MKKDISSRVDIETVVNAFYDKVRNDKVIGHIFNDLARVDWDKHLPVMYAFWENVIFQTGTYTGNPIETHRRLNKMLKLEKKHFQQWNKLFLQTINENFEGTNAELAKQRALSISTVIQIKLTE